VAIIGCGMRYIYMDKKEGMMWSAYVYLGARLFFAAGFQGFIDSGKGIDQPEEQFPAITIQVPLKLHYQTPDSNQYFVPKLNTVLWMHLSSLV
jgi:hypothetical protein